MSANPDDKGIKEIFDRTGTIAVVGLSSNTSKPSHGVAKYLQSQGYRIIPVNPKEDTILGEKAYPDLKSIPEKIDVVDVFRRPEHIPEIADEAVEIKADVLWLQEGIVNEEAAEKARKAGLTVVQDACMLQEHKRLAR